MSVTRRGKVFYLRIRPFGPELITVRTPAQTKTEAMRIERAILTACQAADYRSLDTESSAVCVSMFRNRGWEIPEDLAGSEPVREELTLWDASELFLNYPTVKDSPAKERYMSCLHNLVKKWGKQKALKSLWVPDLRVYEANRLTEGAAPATVNREIGTLSKLFCVMVELQLVETNPCRMVKRLSEKSGERQVYISFQDVQEILAVCRLWMAPIVKVAYCTGMRLGEILTLTRNQVDLKRRLIIVGPEDTKEGHWKRIPIHRDLIPTLEEVLKLHGISSTRIFLKDGHPVSRFSVYKQWLRIVKRIGFQAIPRFHDLRHTWKANALESGMDFEIRESIMGHQRKEKSVSERYGRIRDPQLIRAIELMTFDHGDTEILVAKGQEKGRPGEQAASRQKSVRKLCAKRIAAEQCFALST